MTLKLIQAPAVEPITLEQAKLHLRVDSTAEDELIAAMLTAAREAAEHETGRALISQTWERVLDSFPTDEIELGWPTVLGIVSVSYIDADGVSQNLDPSTFVLDNVVTPGWLFPAVDADWPETYPTINAVRIRFISGYGENGDAVPEPIKRWIMLTMSSLYKQRESFVNGTISAEVAGRFVAMLLDRYRTYWAN